MFSFENQIDRNGEGKSEGNIPSEDNRPGWGSVKPGA